MRQLLYVSESLIGQDRGALDALMIQARNNNALDGITGLLWTDGQRFAQVLEGGDDALDTLLPKLARDPRHRKLDVIQDRPVNERQFGGWAMALPSCEAVADAYQQRMLEQLAAIGDAPSSIFMQIISSSGRHASASG